MSIKSETNTLTSTNALTSVTVGDARNATIDVPAQVGTEARSGTGGFAVTLAPNTEELRFTVRRRGPGAVHVPLTVRDGCPLPWETFVGGGPGAF